MTHRGDPRGIHDRRPRHRHRHRARSASPPPADGGAGAISMAARRSPAEVAAASVRGCSVPPRRGDGRGVSSRPQLESLRVASLMDQPHDMAVHPQLRLLLSRAMARLKSSPVFDDAVLDEFLQQISDALLGADFKPEMVAELRSKVKNTVDITTSSSASAVQQAVIRFLCRSIDSGTKPTFVPKKGKTCVVLVMGVQGSGITTSSLKFAYLHQLKGYRASVVFTDTRGVESFDSLKHFAHEAKIPFYGSCIESDPVEIAAKGVVKFQKENSDLIIIDGSGSSKDRYLSEICQIKNATKPDLTILVVDAGCGRTSFDQAQTFKRKLPIGSVIVTKMDVQSNGASALNGLATARLPVIILGTGKRIQEFKIFDVKLFSNNLLDQRTRNITIDTEDIHSLFDNMKLSDAERRSAINEVEKNCQSAYNAVLEKHRILVEEITHLNLKYRGLCDVLGEEDLKHTDIQSATKVEERRRLMLKSIKILENEKNSRTNKLHVLLSKACDLWDSLGATSNVQRKYKHMLENFSLSVQEGSSLSIKSLKKLEIIIEELELKEAQKPDKKVAMDMHLPHADQLKDYIVRQGKMYIRRVNDGGSDFSGLKELINMTEAWQSKHGQEIQYEESGLLFHLNSIEDRLNPDISRYGDLSTSDTEMVHSCSSKTDTEMGSSSSGTSSGTSSSDSRDPDYSPHSEESDIEMGRMVVHESPDLM